MIPAELGRCRLAVSAILNGVQGLTYSLIDPEGGLLNLLGLNSLCSFPVDGSVVRGVRRSTCLCERVAGSADGGMP
jgi:hypothetical protein